MLEDVGKYKFKASQSTGKNTIIITEEGLGINTSEIDFVYILMDTIANPRLVPIEEGPPFAINFYAWKEVENKSYQIASFCEMEDFTEAISSLLGVIRNGGELWDVRDYL